MCRAACFHGLRAVRPQGCVLQVRAAAARGLAGPSVFILPGTLRGSVHHALPRRLHRAGWRICRPCGAQLVARSSLSVVGRGLDIGVHCAAGPGLACRPPSPPQTAGGRLAAALAHARFCLIQLGHALWQLAVAVYSDTGHLLSALPARPAGPCQAGRAAAPALRPGLL